MLFCMRADRIFSILIPPQALQRVVCHLKVFKPQFSFKFKLLAAIRISSEIVNGFPFVRDQRKISNLD